MLWSPNEAITLTCDGPLHACATRAVLGDTAAEPPAATSTRHTKPPATERRVSTGNCKTHSAQHWSVRDEQSRVCCVADAMKLSCVCSKSTEVAGTAWCSTKACIEAARHINIVQPARDLAKPTDATTTLKADQHAAKTAYNHVTCLLFQQYCWFAVKPRTSRKKMPAANMLPAAW
jgi:hypothetical protein